MKALNILVFAVLGSFFGCHTYTVTTEDVKNLFTGANVPSITIHNDSPFPIQLSSSRFRTTLQPGQEAKFRYENVIFQDRGGKSHSVEIGVYAESPGKPIGSTKIRWSFSSSNWRGTDDRVRVVKLNEKANSLVVR